MNILVLQFKKLPPLLLIVFALACFALTQVQAAVNSPDPGNPPPTNTADGDSALAGTTGFYNSAFGWLSLLSNGSASFNTGVGAGTLALNTASENTAVGTGTLESNTTGAKNTGCGTFALFTNSTGTNNVAVGNRALQNIIDGSGNIALGQSAGFSLTTGDNNIDIGNIGVAGESSMIRIGDPAVHEGIFLAGITAMTAEAPNQAVLVDPATGQLGSADVTPEYAIVTVFVDRGNGPSRWAFYSAPLGSPAGTTTGGVFRFSCSAAQAPCKISYGAAVVSHQSTANATIHPRLVIHKDLVSAITFCEYADGGNNNAGLDQILRVPTLAEAVVAMQTPLTMGIGGSLDCGSGQPYPPDGVVTEIWVPEGFYDVWATFAFGLTLDLPPPGE
jgi:hypothetical protein